MKSLKTYLIIAGLLLLFYIVAQMNRPSEVDWSETLSNKDKIPFGTYILYNRAKDIFPKSTIVPYREAIYSVIAEDSIKQSSYIMICPGMQPSKSDYRQLIKYVKDGNDVFIASGFFGDIFEKELKIKTQRFLSITNKGSYVNFLNPNLNPKKHYEIGKGAGNTFFSGFDTLKAVALGENASHKINFIKYNIGKGTLYLFTDPRFLTNYSLLKTGGAEYAAALLSHIKATKKIVWDEYYTQGPVVEGSLMEVFLRNPVLQWAYYISIFTMLIFVLFEMKRRQRIIPVIEPLKNTSLEFVTVVGQVYYEKRDNADIAHKKIRYFFAQLRDRYRIKSHKPDEEMVNVLTAKLNMDKVFLNEMMGYLDFISIQEKVSDQELIKLNQYIEQFLSKAR